jgi:uncharacterized membrane protein YhaH (DUF805 family)
MTETTKKSPKQTEEKLDALMLIKIWVDGWKKTFTLQGRSSRFELWTFILLNSILAFIAQLRCSYIMSTRFLVDAHARGYSINEIENSIIIAEIIFYTATLIPLIPTATMLIRRMHDLGELAWKKYLEPIFMAFATIGILGYAQLSINSEALAYLSMIISVCIITLLYSGMFYSTKFLVKTLFYIGDNKKNEYGKAMYKDEMHEEHALNFICLYALFALTIGALYLAVGLL